MEHLEKIALEEKPVVRGEKIESYKGLTLLDDQSYNGGTSIMYWM